MRYHFLWGPIYNNAFSFENAYIKMRLGLSLPQLICRAFTSKNVLKVDQNKTHTCRIRVDSQNAWKWKRRPAPLFVACTKSSSYVTKCNSIIFKRFNVDSRKRIETVVWRRIERWVFEGKKKHTFENALVWTGPERTLPKPLLNKRVQSALLIISL